MRVTRAIKEYIESRVTQATETQFNELVQKSKAWNEEHPIFIRGENNVKQKNCR